VDGDVVTKREEFEAVIAEAQLRVQPVLDIIAVALVEREVELILAERESQTFR